MFILSIASYIWTYDFIFFLGNQSEQIFFFLIKKNSNLQACRLLSCIPVDIYFMLVSFYVVLSVVIRGHINFIKHV